MSNERQYIAGTVGPPSDTNAPQEPPIELSASAAQRTHDAQIEVWTRQQQELATQLRVPASELYQVSPSCHCCAGARVDSAATQPVQTPWLGAVDESFVHKCFRLPLRQLQPVIAQATEDECDGADALRGVRAAFGRQLQVDVARQQQWIKQQDGRRSSEGPEGCPATLSLPELSLVGGIDISFVPNTALGVACLAVLSYPALEPVATFMHHCELTEPYLSGFLAFREVPPVLALFSRCRAELQRRCCVPQLLFVDGCGVHHPRRCGLASHLGVLLGIPTIGCSKKMLCVDGITREAVETWLQPQGPGLGSSSSSSHREKHKHTGTPLPPLHPIIGQATVTAASRSHKNKEGLGTESEAACQLYGYAVETTGMSAKRCIYVSPGDQIGFAMAVALVLTVCLHRVPEPVRVADLSSRAYIRAGKALAQDPSPS